MLWLKEVNEERLLLLRFWIPALVTGAIVWVLMLGVGETPLLRTSGLALVIVGLTLALRRMGAMIAIIGGLSLALSPAFWSQTGGAAGEPATIVIALAVAISVVLLAAVVSKRPYIGLGLGIVVFAALFWSQIGTPRSIRLTGFIIGWLMYLLVDMLLLTNPRPEDAPMILRDGGLKAVDGAIPARPYHTFGILLLVTIGIMNDPLLTLLIPAIVVSLLLAHTRLNWWYWLLIGIVIGIGLRGVWLDYWVGQAHFIALGNWRAGTEWLTMIDLLVNQFTILGAGLSLLGLARLARWYPPLGIVSMLSFAAYWFFGLVYSGPREELLLLPMFFVFVLWMSYAVLAISEWSAKTFSTHPRFGRYLAISIYGLLPLFMILRIFDIYGFK